MIFTLHHRGEEYEISAEEVLFTQEGTWYLNPECEKCRDRCWFDTKIKVNYCFGKKDGSVYQMLAAKRLHENFLGDDCGIL